jgi:hypothetical protein
MNGEHGYQYGGGRGEAYINNGSTYVQPTAGQANTGGGGGGGGYNSDTHTGKAGGSGLVIIRYVVG